MYENFGNFLLIVFFDEKIKLYNKKIDFRPDMEISSETTIPGISSETTIPGISSETPARVVIAAVQRARARPSGNRRRPAGGRPPEW